MHPDDFEYIASVLTTHNIKELDILGGEPLLHKEILKLLDIARSYFEKIYISTNGSNLNELWKIKRLYPDITAGISLNSRIDNELREYIMENRPVLKSLFNGGVIQKDFEEFIRQEISYYLIYRDILSKDDLMRAIPFYEFIRSIEALTATYPNVKPVYCEGFISRGGQWRCPAGSTKLSIMPDGSVYPCYLFFKFPEFRLGNILNTDLEHLLKNPVLTYFRNFQENSCRNPYCHLKDACHGGCPAQSYIIYRDIGRPDPRCNWNVTGH